MEKEFNRSTGRKISQRVQEVLSEVLKEEGFEFIINGGTYTDDKLKLNLEVYIKNKNGTRVVSDKSHEIADMI